MSFLTLCCWYCWTVFWSFCIIICFLFSIDSSILCSISSTFFWCTSFVDFSSFSCFSFSCTVSFWSCKLSDGLVSVNHASFAIADSCVFSIAFISCSCNRCIGTISCCTKWYRCCSANWKVFRTRSFSFSNCTKKLEGLVSCFLFSIACSILCSLSSTSSWCTSFIDFSSFSCFSFSCTFAFLSCSSSNGSSLCNNSMFSIVSANACSNDSISYSCTRFIGITTSFCIRLGCFCSSQYNSSSSVSCFCFSNCTTSSCSRCCWLNWFLFPKLLLAPGVAKQFSLIKCILQEIRIINVLNVFLCMDLLQQNIMLNIKAEFLKIHHICFKALPEHHCSYEDQEYFLLLYLYKLVFR